MATSTKIEWCDHSASPWYGCTEVHAGCDHCYARELAKRNPATLGVWGDAGTRVKSKSFIRNLLAWNKAAAAAGRIDSVFPSLCDPFEDCPELEPWRREMFDTIDRCQNLRLLLLTKRPQNVRRMWPLIREIGTHRIIGNHRKNCWLLTSISDQPTANAMIPELLRCRDLCSVLGVSAEPLLGPVNLTRWVHAFDVSRDEAGADLGSASGGSDLNWIIVGGESGSHARPCDVDWIRSIVGQCRDAAVSCFVKQLGEHVHTDANDHGWGREFLPLHVLPDGRADNRFPLGYRVLLKDKKGGEPAEWPDDLRVREFPVSIIA